MDRSTTSLARLGVPAEAGGAWAGRWIPTAGPALPSLNPATGAVLGEVRPAGRAEYEAAPGCALERVTEWRARPAPRRGALVRRLGELLRRHREALGELVSLEVGKIRSEGVGEVQEMIDICD